MKMTGCSRKAPKNNAIHMVRHHDRPRCLICGMHLWQPYYPSLHGRQEKLQRIRQSVKRFLISKSHLQECGSEAISPSRPVLCMLTPASCTTAYALPPGRNCTSSATVPSLVLNCALPLIRFHMRSVPSREALKPTFPLSTCTANPVTALLKCKASQPASLLAWKPLHYKTDSKTNNASIWFMKLCKHYKSTTNRDRQKCLSDAKGRGSGAVLHVLLLGNKCYCFVMWLSQLF